MAGVSCATAQAGYKRTKIVCTLGPATDNEAVLRQMIVEGLNVARLNFSHGNHEEHLGRANMIKRLRDELGLPIALMLDTKGPEIRIGTFREGKVQLVEGSKFTFTAREIEGDMNGVSLSYKSLPKLVKQGDTILGDNGMLEFRVEARLILDIELCCCDRRVSSQTGRASMYPA